MTRVFKRVEKLSDVTKNVDVAATIEPVNLLTDLATSLSKLSIKQTTTALEALYSMSPLIDGLVDIGSKINSVRASTGIENLKAVVEMVDGLRVFTERFKTGSIFTKSTVDRAKVADAALRSFIPMLRTLAEIEGIAGDFQGIRMNVEMNVLKPLLDLEPGVQKVKQLVGAFGELNRELAKLVKENGKALTQVTDLNKGNGAGFKINLPFVKSNDKINASASPTNDPLEKIAENVAAIKEKVVGERKSWLFG
jgi:hypothetical protein